MMGTRRIIRLDEEHFVLRRSRRISKYALFRRIMRRARLCTRGHTVRPVALSVRQVTRPLA